MMRLRPLPLSGSSIEPVQTWGQEAAAAIGLKNSKKAIIFWMLTAITLAHDGVASVTFAL
jgi:hypothetical protein